MGRRKKDIDPEQVRKLAIIGCSLREIGAILGCDHQTIARRFSTEVALGDARGKIILRRKQMKRAMTGSDTMLIHLGMNRLDQRQKNDTTSKDEKVEGGPIFNIYSNDRSAPVGEIPDVPAAAETTEVPEQPG